MCDFPDLSRLRKAVQVFFMSEQANNFPQQDQLVKHLCPVLSVHIDLLTAAQKESTVLAASIGVLIIEHMAEQLLSFNSTAQDWSNKTTLSFKVGAQDVADEVSTLVTHFRKHIAALKEHSHA